MHNKFNGPQYSTPLFCDVWDDCSKFLTDYAESGIPTTIPTTGKGSATTIFWLLYARHGNDPIANMDQYQWKQKVFAIIFQYGPCWAKELSMQETLQGLTDAQLKAGAFTIFNHALNPETVPTTSSTTELTYINEQNTNRYEKGILDAYSQLDMLLKRDVTNDLMQKFDKLFKAFVYPERPIIFNSEKGLDDD